jgi:hypothetical protein
MSPARALYLASGFRPSHPFADVPDDPLRAFLELALDP